MIDKHVAWPLEEDNPPSTIHILDLIEFCFLHVAAPIPIKSHPFYSHHHLHFNQEEGQANFVEQINRIFERNGIAYKMKGNGEIARILPEMMVNAISTRYESGDSELDQMIDHACNKILDNDPTIRKESLEKLWDAWERLKTLLSNNKKESITALLDRASSESNFRELIENEARKLSEIGNNFMIRHTEVDKTPIEDADQIDYLFHRLYALIHLIIKRIK